MAFKIVGLIMLFTVSVYSGQYAAYLRIERLKQTEAFCSLISHIKACVEYFNSPLEEIYSSFDNKTLSECGFIKRMCEEGFNRALSCTGLRLKGEELTLLREFSARIGRIGRDKQLADCEYTLLKLEKIYNLQEAELPKATRLSKSFGLMTGIMLVILFI